VSTVATVFADRAEAGRALAHRLKPFATQRPVVLGLPRGGVPVAAAVASALGAQLDVIVVRKLGLPGRPEIAMGAIGEGDVRHVDWRVVYEAGVTAAQLADVIKRERAEVSRRARGLRAGRRRIDISGRVVIIVDDGIATGSTAMAAVKVARELGALQVIIAAPVAPAETVDSLRSVADRVIVLETPDPFYGVAQGYLDFHQVRDADMMAILQEHRSRGRPPLRRPA
jgi:putative phosphoribosyl transferase